MIEQPKLGNMETFICPVCGKYRQNNIIALPKGERDRLANATLVEYELCDDDKKKYLDNMIALVSIDPQMSFPPFTPETVARTGAIFHLHAKKFKHIFGVTPEDSAGRLQPVVFVPDELIAELIKKVQPL